MTALTDSQIARLRRVIGDDRPDNDFSSYDLSDADIQDAYDRNSSVEATTIVDLLQQRLGMWLNLVDEASEIGATQRSQKLKNIERALKYWEGKATTSGGSATFGTLDLGYIQDDDSS